MLQTHQDGHCLLHVEFLFCLVDFQDALVDWLFVVCSLSTGRAPILFPWLHELCPFPCGWSMVMSDVRFSCILREGYSWGMAGMAGMASTFWKSRKKITAPLSIVPSCRSGFRVTSSHWPFAAEEPDSLQKVGDFISGPFILPFVVAVVSSVTFVGGGTSWWSPQMTEWCLLVY